MPEEVTFIIDPVDLNLEAFAEYHKNIGIDLGRAQMLREICDRDPIIAEEVRQLLARTTQ